MERKRMRPGRNTGATKQDDRSDDAGTLIDTLAPVKRLLESTRTSVAVWNGVANFSSRPTTAVQAPRGVRSQIVQILLPVNGDGGRSIFLPLRYAIEVRGARAVLFWAADTEVYRSIVDELEQLGPLPRAVRGGNA